MAAALHACCGQALHGPPVVRGRLMGGWSGPRRVAGRMTDQCGAGMPDLVELFAMAELSRRAERLLSSPVSQAASFASSEREATLRARCTSVRSRPGSR